MFTQVKKVLLSILISFSSLFIFAKTYKINTVTYDISGLTREWVLNNKLKVDRTKVFQSETEFNEYIQKLKQDLINTRCFQFSDIEVTLNETTDPDYTADLLITTKDSFHLLGLPYGKFSSSGGASIKIKLKDTNFLGTMQELNADVDFAFKPDSEGNQFQIFEPSIGLSVNYPFEKDPFNFVWSNNFSMAYQWGQDSPEWNISSGLLMQLPLEYTTLNWKFTQGFIREYDYRSYGDAMLLSENFSFYTPFKLADLPKVDSLYVTPTISMNYNWDPFNWNGASGINYHSLQSPTFTISTPFSMGRIDWNGNYRDGVTVSFTPSITYNVMSHVYDDINMFDIGLSIDSTAFKSFKNLAFYSKSRFFTYIHNINNPKINGSSTFDGNLRGIIDSRNGTFGENQTTTPLGLVFNFDMPIHIFTTDWENAPITKHWKFMRHLNFELIVSPFVDIGLMQTTVARQGYNRTFDLRDGFYTAGVEVLVYPLKWSSYVVRASVGVDIGRKLFGDLLETSWRNNGSSIEISIGIGTHY